MTLSGPEAAASSEPREVHGGGDEGLGAEAADRQGCPDTGGEGEERHRQVKRVGEEEKRGKILPSPAALLHSLFCDC